MDIHHKLYGACVRVSNIKILVQNAEYVLFLRLNNETIFLLFHKRDMGHINIK